MTLSRFGDVIDSSTTRNRFNVIVTAIMSSCYLGANIIRLGLLMNNDVDFIIFNEKINRPRMSRRVGQSGSRKRDVNWTSVW